MLVQLFKFGQDEIVTTFPIGIHDLGRGTTLQCNDKRVSRNHATLEINDNTIILTSTHINPCFIRSEGSKTIRILKKDKSEELNNGDSFALLPDDFWFKIKVIHDESQSDNQQVTLKRLSCDKGESPPPDKKIKVDEEIKQNENEETGTSMIKEETTERNPTVTVNEEIENVEETNLMIKSENEIVNNPETHITAEEIKDATSETKDEEASTSKNDETDKPSSPKSRREKCWYAHECYRTNPQHRDEFSHPGDSDFETDSQDNRPTCSYGAKCYRKNKQHRQNFKHPPREPPGKKKRNRKKVDRLNVATSQEINELLDSESEDPFIDDGDSDEYAGESDDDDSDWQEDEDEESENMRRLVKEAKKFVNK